MTAREDFDKLIKIEEEIIRLRDFLKEKKEKICNCKELKELISLFKETEEYRKTIENSNKENKTEKILDTVAKIISEMLGLKSKEAFVIDFEEKVDWRTEPVKRSLIITPKGLYNIKSWNIRMTKLRHYHMDSYFTQGSLNSLLYHLTNDKHKEIIKVLWNGLKEVDIIDYEESKSFEKLQKVRLKDLDYVGELKEFEIKFDEILLRNGVVYFKFNSETEYKFNVELLNYDTYPSLSLIIQYKEELLNLFKKNVTEIKSMAERIKREQKEFNEIITPHLVVDVL